MRRNILLKGLVSINGTHIMQEEPLFLSLRFGRYVVCVGCVCCVKIINKGLVLLAFRWMKTISFLSIHQMLYFEAIEWTKFDFGCGFALGGAGSSLSFLEEKGACSKTP